MMKEKVRKDAFHIIGISVRTINGNGQAARDIKQLWNTFVTQNVIAQIPNKVEDIIYAVYTNYDGDHDNYYDTILGCKVSSLKEIPDGMVGQSFEGGDYMRFVAKGDMTAGAVYKEWDTIWKSGLDRAYTQDFEVFGERAVDPTDAEVDIFVALKGA